VSVSAIDRRRLARYLLWALLVAIVLIYAFPFVYLILTSLKSPTDVEDVVEETFWQAWRQADRFDAERGTVQTWLLTMARSRVLDRLRDLAVPELLLLLWVVAVQEADVTGQNVKPVALLAVAGPHYQDSEQGHVMFRAVVVDAVEVVDELDVMPVPRVEVRIKSPGHLSVGDGLTRRVTGEFDQVVKQLPLSCCEDNGWHGTCLTFAV